MINLDKIAEDRLRELVKGILIGFSVQEDVELPGLKHPEYLVEATIYTPEEQIDGHWLVRLHTDISKKIDPDHDCVIGVTSHKDRIIVKTYTCAREYATALSQQTSKTLNDRTPTSIRSS